MKSKLSLTAIAIAAVVAGAARGQQCQPSVAQNMRRCVPGKPHLASPCVIATAILDQQHVQCDARQRLAAAKHVGAIPLQRRRDERLSQAGRTKVQWIATQAMPNRRQIYVQQSDSAEATSERIASVQRFVATGYPNGGEHVVVNETPMQFEGRPAASVDTTMVGYQANQPAPVLPSSAGSSSQQFQQQRVWPVAAVKPAATAAQRPGGRGQRTTRPR